MTHGYFATADGNLYYEISGENHAETLVLSHAAFLDGRMWDTQLDAFAQHFRVVRYDMVGYGKSDKATMPHSRRDDLYGLLQHLNIQKAHLLGCSMGGEMVLDLALEYPELVQSLIIVNGTPSGFEVVGEPPKYLMEMLGLMQQGNIDQTSELQLRIWFDGEQRTPEQVNAEQRQYAGEMNRIFVANNTWAIANFTPVNPLTPPALNRLSEVRVPTLIITGALDHPEILRAAQIMKDGIPNAQHINIPDTAHVPNMEKPEMFNRVVLDFLIFAR